MQNMTTLMQQLSEPVTIRLIKTEADYEAALAELDGMNHRVDKLRSTISTKTSQSKSPLYIVITHRWFSTSHPSTAGQRSKRLVFVLHFNHPARIGR